MHCLTAPRKHQHMKTTVYHSEHLPPFLSIIPTSVGQCYGRTKIHIPYRRERNTSHDDIAPNFKRVTADIHYLLSDVSGTSSVEKTD